MPKVGLATLVHGGSCSWLKAKSGHSRPIWAREPLSVVTPKSTPFKSCNSTSGIVSSKDTSSLSIASRDFTT
eukprot:5167499-Pleurochrysis_carterae.AAC.1